LALHGAKVYLGARTDKKATAAIARLETDNPSLKGRGLVVWLPLDLTRPADVKKSAENFLAKEERLDILGIQASLGR